MSLFLIVTKATTGGYADLPMHPSCFEIFKRMSKAHFGNVDVDGLWKVREVSLAYNYVATVH